VDIQILALRIEMPENFTFKQLILIALYRSSSPFSTFANMIHKRINPLLSTTNSNNSPKKAIILGDFNVNLLDPKHRDLFINCPQYVKEATHISGSLLDHVY